MSAQSGAGRCDVALRLLDHQIVGPDGQLLGNVDDLEIVRTHDDWMITGLMVGPAALSQRLPGRLGEWWYAVWRRLHPAADPAAVVVPIESVVGMDSAIHVDGPAALALAGTFGLEIWLREHVVSRLPGATNGSEEAPSAAGEHEPGPLDAPSSTPLPPGRAPLEGARPLSSILGRTIVDAAGNVLGRASEVRCTVGALRERQGPLRVLRVLCTRRLTASRLGYSVDSRQGPTLVRRVIRIWQRHDRMVDVDDLVGLDTRVGDLRVRLGATLRHPYDDA